MDKVQSYINIDKSHRSRVVLKQGEVIPLFNGNFVIGEVRPSGLDNENPDLTLVHFEIDEQANQVTSEEIWRVTLSNLITKNSGQKAVWPAFAGDTDRLFIRARSSGNGSDGLPNNVIQEIDPADGSYIGNPLVFSGGSFTDYFEISTDGIIYAAATDGDSVVSFDLDFNSLTEYSGVSNASDVRFSVSENRDVAMVQHISPGTVRILDKAGNFLQSITTAILDEDTQVADVRMSNTHLIIFGNANVYCFERDSYTRLWKLSGDSYTAAMFGLDGNLYLGRDDNVDVYLRKVDIETAAPIWETHAIESGTTSPIITNILQISRNIIVTYHGVLGVTLFFRTDGSKYGGSIGTGRGHIGLHPFNNDRIQNYDLD